MEETAQNFEKRFLLNRSQICIALPKFYVTHRIYEILSKSLVPNVQCTSMHEEAQVAPGRKDDFSAEKAPFQCTYYLLSNFGKAT